MFQFFENGNPWNWTFSSFFRRRHKRLFNKKIIFKCLQIILVISVFIVVSDLSGAHRHFLEKDYFTEFSYPLETANFKTVVQMFRFSLTLVRDNDPEKVDPINLKYSTISYTGKGDIKCSEYYYLLILVKSAPTNFDNRAAIRDTWKSNSEGVKTIFVVGTPDNTSKTLVMKNNRNTKLISIQEALHEEMEQYNDIIQADFIDSYYNNTMKIMLEIRWIVEKCSKFDYALLVDDDYYVSIKNLRSFVQHPTKYPKAMEKIADGDHSVQRDFKLYSGFKMFVSPHRHKIWSKWYLPLWEYPFHLFPPYITAGAILLSKSALLDIYYASFFTHHFRFDDIYIAICAKKMDIDAVHSEYFRFWSTSDESPDQYLIASHGFRDPEKLRRFWDIQTKVGYV